MTKQETPTHIHNQPEGVVLSLQGPGINHDASNGRSYNSDENVYTDPRQLQEKWRIFSDESIAHDRRRAVMRTYVASEILGQLGSIPIEAIIPLGDKSLVWIGQNQHQRISPDRNVRDLPSAREQVLPPNYTLDHSVRLADKPQLLALWQQFGWEEQGIENYILTNQNPLVVIRDENGLVVGAMISEAAQFGAWALVELTELAVGPEHRGRGLASILIGKLAQEINNNANQRTVTLGEYNLTTQSYKSAAQAGQTPAQTSTINGVLVDHVAIETGDGNVILPAWGPQTQWLHSYLVMYQLAQQRNG